MPSRIHHYSDSEIARYRRFWFFLYKQEMPYYSDEEIIYLITRYKCPPWRWPAPAWYKGKLNAMRAETIRAQRERHIDITMSQAQKLAEERMEENASVKRKVPEKNDPKVWAYRLDSPSRKKGVIRLK